MRHDFYEVRGNLLHGIQGEKIPEMHTTSTNTSIGRKGCYKQNMTLHGKYSSIQKGNTHVNAS
jgi:hypothetical protein